MAGERERETGRVRAGRIGLRPKGETGERPGGIEEEEALPAATASHADKAIFKLQAELERIQIRLADFEQKYRMSFEEFQADLRPDSPLEIEQDCLEWSRWAERRRALASELERASRLRERLPPEAGGKEPAAPEDRATRIRTEIERTIVSASGWPGRRPRREIEASSTGWAQGVQPSRRKRPQG